MDRTHPTLDPAIQSSPQLTVVLDRFEQSWQTGSPPNLAEFVKDVTDAETRRQMLLELVAIDLEFRWRRFASADKDSVVDQTWKIDDYIDAHPELGPTESVPLALIMEEYRARRRWDNTVPVHQEYLTRFSELPNDLVEALKCVDRELTAEAAQTIDQDGRGTDKDSGRGSTLRVRCPHCQSLVETSRGGSMADLTCGTCGSSFSLVDENRETRSATIRETFAHFDLVEKIGFGAFGEVWKARDRELDRTVAIKIPRKGQLDANEAEKFLREARAAAQLKHPNIVGVHEVGKEDGTLYIVSDLIRGLTLADWLTGQRPTQIVAAELCGKIAEALHHAHEAGVVHRDLKPGNIMLDEASQPHVMDFGLAKRDAGEVTMTIDGQILGTPAYMSPEQARGEAHDVDRRSDIYSLGVILFELLTGEIPFRGNMRMMIHQVIHEEPPSPRKLNNTLDRDLDTICLKCLEKEAANRYATAQDLADELSRYLAHEPIQARPISRAARAGRWCKRHPGVASLSALVFVVFLTGVASTTHWALLSREAELRAQSGARRAVESLVTALMFAAPDRVSQSIDVLRSHREDALPMLRDQFELATGVPKFQLALGLAAMGNAPHDFLADQTAIADPSNAANLLTILSAESQANAERSLKRFEDLKQYTDVQPRAKLAVMALDLGRPEAAIQMLQNRPNPIERTIFIETFEQRRHAWSNVHLALTEEHDRDFLSGMCLAIGGVSADSISAEDRQSVATLLADWYRTSDSPGIHAAADWALRKWNEELPEPERASEPRAEVSWYTNDRGITLVRVPVGTFDRPVDDAQSQRADAKGADVLKDARTQTVTVSRSFYLADREITLKQFQVFADAVKLFSTAPRVASQVSSFSRRSQFSNNGLSQLNSADDGPERAVDENLPVQGIITWEYAVLYCNWLSKREGLQFAYRKSGDWKIIPEANGYRLPTEAEWELACRAGTSTMYCFGNDLSRLQEYSATRTRLQCR